MPVPQRSLSGKIPYEVEQQIIDLIRAADAQEAMLQRPSSQDPAIAALQSALDRLNTQVQWLTAGGNEPSADPASGGGNTPTGVTPGTYGDSTHVGQFTVNALGKLTAAADVAIAGVGTGINQLTGDGTAGPGSGSQVFTLAASGVTPGSYGDSLTVPPYTVDSKGRLTAASAVAIATMVGDSGSGGTKGFAPAPSAGDAALGKFLSAAGIYSVPPGASASGVFTTTATGNQDDLNIGGAAVLLCNNATTLTIRGIVAAAEGQPLTILAIGAGNVFLEHQNSNSSANNRLDNTVTSGPTPLAAASGYARYVYANDGSTSRWRLCGHEQGEWLVYSFSAGDFIANGSMTWTVASGDVFAITYKVLGNSLLVSFNVTTTTVGGSVNTQLRWTMPHGFAASTQLFGFCGMCRNIAAGTIETGFAGITASGTTINFSRLTNGNWVSGTDNTSVAGLITVPLT